MIPEQRRASSPAWDGTAIPMVPAPPRCHIRGVSATAVRRTAYAGVVAALVYATLKAAWGLGATVGITDMAAFDRFVAGFGSFEWIATWGTVVLALLAAGLLLALVEPWGQRLPRRTLRAAAWFGAAVLAVPGFAGVAESVLTYAGVLDEHDNGMAEWVFLLTYGSFSMLSIALASSAWYTRAEPPHRRIPGSAHRLGPGAQEPTSTTGRA